MKGVWSTNFDSRAAAWSEGANLSGIACDLLAPLVTSYVGSNPTFAAASTASVSRFNIGSAWRVCCQYRGTIKG
jgi:hypothetical protein